MSKVYTDCRPRVAPAGHREISCRNSTGRSLTPAPDGPILVFAEIPFYFSIFVIYRSFSSIFPKMLRNFRKIQFSYLRNELCLARGEELIVRGPEIGVPSAKFLFPFFPWKTRTCWVPPDLHGIFVPTQFRFRRAAIWKWTLSKLVFHGLQGLIFKKTKNFHLISLILESLFGGPTQSYLLSNLTCLSAFVASILRRWKSNKS